MIAILCLHTLHPYLNLQTETETTCFYLPNAIISYIRHPHHLLKKKRPPNPISFCFHFEVMLILLPVKPHSFFDIFQLNIIDSQLSVNLIWERLVNRYKYHYNKARETYDSYSNSHFCIWRLQVVAITLSFNIDSMFSFLSASLQVDLDLSLYDSYLHC